MTLEIERKFLLADFPTEWVASGQLRWCSRQIIEQSYLAITQQEEIRVRRITEVNSDDESIHVRTGNGVAANFTHTFKRGHGLVREEIEYEISEQLYQQLLTTQQMIPLIKVRTTVEWSGTIFEIDQYDQLRLTVVEVEFASEVQANQFEPPAWFGIEVGANKAYSNRTIWRNLQNKKG